MYDTFPRFDGMMPFLPSRQQAQDLLIERQRKHELKQVEEHKRSIQALREDFGKYMCEYSSLKTSPPITPKMPPISEKPPDSPDINQSDPIYATKAAPEMIETSLLSNITSKTSKKKLAIPLKYSCDEIYERMTNGLCIFCEEQDIHDHQLKHKRFQIFVKECDDQPFDDEELVEPAVETSSALLLPNREDTLRCMSGVKDVKVTNMIQEEESSTEKETKPEVFHLIETVPYHQVLNSNWKRRRKNRLQSHTLVRHGVDKLIVSKVLACANKKRPLDPGITKMFKKSLECLGAHNKKFEPKLEIYKDHNSTNQKLRVMYHCQEIESSWFKKLHETGLSMRLQKNPELVIPLLKDWIVNTWFKIQVCSCFDLTSWNGLEIYGCKYKKQMLLLVKQCYSVSECGEFLATNIYWKLLEKLYKRDSVLNTRSRLFCFADDRIISFKGLQSYCLEDLTYERPAYLVELNKLLWCEKDIGERTTEVNQYLALFTNALGVGNMAYKRLSKLGSKTTTCFGGNEITTETNLKKQKEEWLITQDEVNKVQEEIMKRLLKANETLDDFSRVKKLITDVRFEIVSSKVALVFSRELRQFTVTMVIKGSFFSLLRNVSFYLEAQNEAERVDKLKYNFIEKDAESIILAATDECKDRETYCVLLGMGLNGDTHKVSYLVNGYGNEDVMKLNVASFHGTSLRLLYGSLPRPPDFRTIKKSLERVSIHEKDNKLWFPKNHKLLHPRAGFCTQHNNLEHLSTDLQSFPDLDYFSHLIHIWNQVLNCGCEADRISYGIFSVYSVHESDTCSKLQIGGETQGKMLLVLAEVSPLDNANEAEFVVKENWFHNNPTIEELFHLQRPPEL